MQPIGAYVEIVFDGEFEVRDRYISFLDYIDDVYCDAAGIPDDQIFYYMGDETELKKYMELAQSEFKIIGYQLAFKEA